MSVTDFAHSHDHDEDHDRGLVHDLSTIGRQLADRRRALRWFASVGTAALVSGCGGGTAGSTGTATTSTTAATTTTTAATTTTTATTTSTAAATTTGTTSTSACIVDPTETNGPYPADGTNTSSGSTSNVLITSGVVRSDIRPSFLATSTVAGGVAVTLTLTVVNANASCAPLAGYAVYIWQCDAGGNYSLYNLPSESYLRGVQVTNAAGQVTFTTIYPGCYSGRWPHIHFEVFTSLAAATSGRVAKLISQLAMPAASNTAVFNTDSRYSASIRNYAAISLSSDNVFADNTAAQIAQQTPTLTGSVAAGYTGTATIGIAV